MQFAQPRKFPHFDPTTEQGQPDPLSTLAVIE
jgi:hypothetical protein